MSDLPRYQDETPAECYDRRMRARKDDLKKAHTALARARAFARGRKFCGCVFVSAEDASEEAIETAIRRLMVASYVR